MSLSLCCLILRSTLFASLPRTRFKAECLTRFFNSCSRSRLASTSALFLCWFLVACQMQRCGAHIPHLQSFKGAASSSTLMKTQLLEE